MDDDRGEALSLLPKMSVNVKSSNPMEVTVTKTCLEVLNKLAKVGCTTARKMKILTRYVISHNRKGMFYVNKPNKNNGCKKN